MKQPTSTTNTRSLGGFKMEDMIYPYIYTVVLMVLVHAPAQSHSPLVVR
jgi:hypothetical protein